MRIHAAIDLDPYFGRIAFSAKVDRPSFARPSNAYAVSHTALHIAEKQKYVHSVEEEIAEFSRDGEVEFSSRIKPGCGFKRKGGMWASEERFSDFSLDGCLAIFVVGFNDHTDHESERECVRSEIDEHVK